MKKLIAILPIVLSVMTGCGGGKQSTDDIITVDVTASYPKKELILQDFLNVEYIPLETSDEFITAGYVQAIGKDIILVTNRNYNVGDIFIFDRNGKGLKMINRKGQGGEEYTNISWITLDEDNGEIFVNDRSAKKILVYNMDGKFKRSFKHKEDASYSNIYNLDMENLICHDGAFISDEVVDKQSFMIISKRDGSVTKEIQIPLEKNKTVMMMKKDDTNNAIHISVPSTDYPIIPCLGNMILVEPSSDTVYSYFPDHRMAPFVARTPSIQSMNPEVFLFLSTITDRYYFMETVKKEYDFEKGSGFPRTYLMYDKQEKDIYEFTVCNGDYSSKGKVYMNSRPVSNEIATWQRLEAYELVEAYNKGELKGKLQEIAAGLDEESNPVIMLAKYRK
jgi:hypothetical protein